MAITISTGTLGDSYSRKTAVIKENKTSISILEECPTEKSYP